MGESRCCIFWAAEGMIIGNQSTDDCVNAHQDGALGEAANLSVSQPNQMC